MPITYLHTHIHTLYIHYVQVDGPTHYSHASHVTYTYTYLHTHTHCTYIHTHIHTYRWTAPSTTATQATLHIHIHTYTYLLTYTHTHTLRTGGRSHSLQLCKPRYTRAYAAKKTPSGSARVYAMHGAILEVASWKIKVNLMFVCMYVSM